MNYYDQIDPQGEKIIDFKCAECSEPIEVEGYCEDCKAYTDFEKRKELIKNKASQLRYIFETTGNNVYAVNKLKEIEKMLNELYYG